MKYNDRVPFPVGKCTAVQHVKEKLYMINNRAVYYNGGH